MLWILYALGSAVFHALGSIFDKKVMEHEHAIEYAGAQGFLALLFLAVLPFVPLGLSWQLMVSIYIASVIFVCGHLYYLRSIRHSELSSAFPLLNISPVFLLLIAFVLLGERPSGIDLLGVFLLIIGTYILQSGLAKKGLLEPFKALVRSKYSLFMVFAMIIFSFTSTMEKGIVNAGAGAITMLVLMRLFVGANHFVLEVYTHGFSEITKDLRKDGKAITLGFIASIGSALFYFLALVSPGALVSLVIPVKRFSTLISSIIGGRLFHEHHLGLKIIACVVMIAGVALVAL